MKILALDSSGLVAGVAVVEDDILLGEYTVNYKKTHSQTLLPMLDEVARMIELDLDSVDAIAVAAGPGSYTGLRIGSATAKGLGLALDKPLVSVPTVDALACNLWGCADLVCPLMDARRGQVYTGLYRMSGCGPEILVSQCAVEIGEIVGEVNCFGEPVVFLGDGVPVFTDFLGQHCGVPYRFAPPHMNRQRAGAVAWLALQYAKEGRLESADDHRPDYLRLSQAERDRLAREKEVRIREMTPEDLCEVAALERATFSEPWSEEGFADALDMGQNLFLVAERAGRIAGYCGLYIAGGEGEVTNVAVDRGERRRGIGDALLGSLLEEAGRRGVLRIFLEVRVSNVAAIRLYERHGFVPCGMRRDFYRLPDEDALIMCCERKGGGK